MSSTSGTREHENALLSRIAACRLHSCRSNLLDLEANNINAMSKNTADPNYSLPGAITMYALALGVQHINEILPGPVYGLLSGMNASTVGIIALAAVQLADKAIKDRFSRILVVFGACAGMCYNALWYFPVLMVIGGIAAIIWYRWMLQSIRKLKAKVKRRKLNTESQVEEASVENSVSLEERAEPSDTSSIQRRNVSATATPVPGSKLPQNSQPEQESQQVQPDLHQNHVIKVRVGIVIAVVFFGKSLHYHCLAVENF